MNCAGHHIMMGGKQLPYLTELEYLESTGTQYIKTGIVGKPPTVAEIDFRWVGTPSADAAILGCRNNSLSAPRFIMLMTNQTKIRQLGVGSSWATYGNFTMDTDYNAVSSFVSGDTTLTLNGSRIIRSTYALADTGVELYLFANNNAGAKDLATARVYGCKIYQSGTLVRDFIPVRKGTVGYLYDRVSGALFGNAGTGDFVLGQDVVPVEYIESHGTEWIDTGFKANTTTTTLETSIELTSMSANAGLFGSRNNTSMANGASCNAFVMSTGKIRLDWASADSNLNIDVQTGVRYEMSVTQGRYVLNGTETTIPISAQSYDQASNFLLFNFYNDTIPFSTGASAKMRYARLYSNSALVRDFIPVRVGTEGAMMDALTRRVYRNAGTGAFTYGNDLPYPIPAS